MNHHLFNEAPAEFRQSLCALDSTVSRTLTYLAIFPHRKGHTFIKDGVLRLIVLYAKGETPGSDLYGWLSLWHRCTPKAVESSIRSAIKTAESLGAIERLNRLFGIAVTDKSYPLSNLQFISLLAQYCYYFTEPPLAAAP